MNDRVTFEGMRYPQREGESALDALLRGGAAARFSCRKGSCHICTLQVTGGEIESSAAQTLNDEQVRAGLFLPCVSRACGEVTIQRPDPSVWVQKALVHDKERLSEHVYRLQLEPGLDVTWQAGQYVNLEGPNGDWRSYSIASVRLSDYFLELHVRHFEGGVVSSWIADQLSAGDEVRFQGPFGSCTYTSEVSEAPLLLIGTGTGIAPLVGVAKQALHARHQAPIWIYHGVRQAPDLYFHAQLTELAAHHQNVQYVGCLSQAQDAGFEHGYAADIAVRQHPDLSDVRVYLAGNPEAVQAARVQAIGAGARRAWILADPFVDGRPYEPQDRELLGGVQPDPEIWSVLGEGKLLTTILTAFYGAVYADPRLEPFFHRVTKARAIQKQYEFLRDVFTGSKDYFGARPFNAHHWMIISDELFDHREDLFFEHVRLAGVPERLIRRWAAFHELFRPAIVKSTPRGLIVDGVETVLEGYTEETLDTGSICDGCESEMASGATGRMHKRTGELFCDGCAARAVGESLLPPGI